jgi:pSer/pThr/pTyr-binding forkhead associated (FHA) protein
LPKEGPIASGAEQDRTPEGLRLALLSEGRIEATYPLHGKVLTIGRSGGSGVALADDRVSKRHARITVGREEVVITDLGSRNGTRVNEHKIRAHALLSGDLVRIGRVCFIFLRPEPEAPRDERSAVGWVLAGSRGGEPGRKLPVTEAPILIGSAKEADIRVPERESPDFMAQILAVPTGTQITNLCSPWPHCSMLDDGTEMRFGSLRVVYTEAERIEMQPTGFVPLSQAAADPPEPEQKAEKAPAGGGPLGDDALTRTLVEEAERAEREVPARTHATEKTGATAPQDLAGYRLTGTAGPASGVSFVAAGKPIVIGRHALCDVTLADPEVSPHHARLTRVEGDTIIEDLDSSTGVYVNGQRIRQKSLQPGDVIVIGSSKFLVHL